MGTKGDAWACPVGLEVSNRGLLLHPGVGCFSLSIAGSYEPGVRRNELSAPIALRLQDAGTIALPCPCLIPGGGFDVPSAASSAYGVPEGQLEEEGCPMGLP